MSTPATIDKPENPWQKRRKGPQTFMPPSRALYAQDGGYVGTATWCYRGNHWKCESASKFLKWMKGCTDTKFMAAHLQERGIEWRWIEPNTAKALAPPF